MKSSTLITMNIVLFLFLACKDIKVTNLKIMSFNIRHGVGMDMKLDLSRSANVILSESPDLCGLQEIDNFCSRSDSFGQTDYLAHTTSMTGTFGKFMDFQEGEYGMATLSKKPILSTKILRLPDGKHEPRISIVHEILVASSCTITFANVHFDWISGEDGSINRLNQARSLVKYLDSLSHTTIITGDFNCTPDSPTMNYFSENGFIFIEKGNDNLSFQGENMAEIDHLIYRNEANVKINHKSIRLLAEPVVSDHRPLIVELEISY